MHDISAEAGISVGLIYRYFKNKDGSYFGDRRRTQKKKLPSCSNAPAKPPPS